MKDLIMKLSEETMVSPQVAKKIIDKLSARGLNPEMFGSVLYEIKRTIKEQAIAEKLNKTTDEEIDSAINERIEEGIGCYTEKEEQIKELAKKFSSDEFPNFLYFQPEITFSEGETFSEDKQYELITTAKQTDHRYGDFAYTKAELETMAKNFNDNVVGTEIPVDLNHDPEHIAYAWIKPGSMEVKKSTNLDGEYSLYAQLYRFTPEGKDIVSTGKIRYFSLQIQNKFDKFIDKAKKTYTLVIRALALTNMPVIKDMAPTFNESGTLFTNHTNPMEREAQLEKELSEKNVSLSEKDRLLSEKDAENKRLSEELAKVSEEKREKVLSEGVEKLCLSADKNIAFKGGEKEKVLAFVKTLSDEQAKAYFELHEGIITGVDLGEHGEAGESEADASEEAAVATADTQAKELAEKTGISYSKALAKVLSENPELAKKIY